MTLTSNAEVVGMVGSGQAGALADRRVASISGLHAECEKENKSICNGNGILIKDTDERKTFSDVRKWADRPHHY